MRLLELSQCPTKDDARLDNEGVAGDAPILSLPHGAEAPGALQVLTKASTAIERSALSRLDSFGRFWVGVSNLSTMGLTDTILNRPELRFLDLLFPWVVAAAVFGFLIAWFIMAVLEWCDLSRHIWHLPLAFVALVVLFSSLIGMLLLP